MKTELPRVGYYELRQKLRRDNVCEVWQAYDNEMQRGVILKLFYISQLESFDALQYIQIVQQISELHHPNIVRIHDVRTVTHQGSDGPVPLLCLALEITDGENLADYIKNTSALGRIPLATEVVHLFSSIALALDNAHQHGIVHGNLKPANIFLAGQSSTASSHIEMPILTDFADLNPTKGSHGIPFYLAPEQIRGARATKESDIYALGVLLYELYTGVPPFRGNRPIAVMMQHINAQPTAPNLVNPAISPALAQVILRCLAKNPRARFSSALTLAVALANALHVELPEGLRLSLARISNADVFQEAQMPAPAPNRQHSNSDSLSLQSAPDAPPDDSPDVFFSSRQKKRTSPLLLILLALVLVGGSGLASWLFLAPKGAPSSIVGHAFFVNSSQLDANTTQGLSDQLQIDLTNIPDPASGKSYYAWLLGDTNKSEAVPVALGRLSVQLGTVHSLYQGDNRHANLFSFISRFLINEDDAQHPASNPLLNPNTWRYYAEIPQDTPTTAQNQNGILDHLRHLLVESPELSARNLHGGLVLWFVKDTAIVSDLANGLVNDWQNKDAQALRQRIIRILDYLDGNAFAREDLPKDTPLLADQQIAQVPLLGEDPAADADSNSYVYEAQPPAGYVYLLELHLNGAVLSPQATRDQRQLAAQINAQIDNIKHMLNIVYQDAKKLLPLTDEQLLTSSSLKLLNDMATQMKYAATGEPDNPSSGSHWVYTSTQRLAGFDITPYTAP